MISKEEEIALFIDNRADKEIKKRVLEYLDKSKEFRYIAIEGAKNRKKPFYNRLTFKLVAPLVMVATLAIVIYPTIKIEKEVNPFMMRKAIVEDEKSFFEKIKEYINNILNSILKEEK